MMALQGLAALPLLLEIFGRWAGAIALIWYLVALVVATQEATDLKTRDAAVSVLIGFAARKSARTGAPVRIADLTTLAGGALGGHDAVELLDQRRAAVAQALRLLAIEAGRSDPFLELGQLLGRQLGLGVLGRGGVEEAPERRGERTRAV